MDANLKKTCLYDRHVALGAKMSPFAGYMMPIQYTTITEEHLAVRNHVGVFDVSHMGEIVVSGPDAEKFVNYVFTNDVRGLAPGKILYGMMLYFFGGTVDDLLVYKEFEPDHFLMVVNASNIEKDYNWLIDNSKEFDVHIENRSEEWGQVAVQGPDAERTMIDVLGIAEASGIGFYEFFESKWKDSRMIVSRTGYTGEDGFEIYASPEAIVEIWDRLLQGGVTPCGLGCRDTLRFEAGLPLYGHELTAEDNPAKAGLLMFCKFDKEFIGKNWTEVSIDSCAGRKLVGLELLDNAIARAGYRVERSDGYAVGQVTTGYHSISLDKSLCLAWVDMDFADLGTQLWVRIRKKTYPCVIVKKRFYQTKYKK